MMLLNIFAAAPLALAPANGPLPLAGGEVEERIKAPIYKTLITNKSPEEIELCTVDALTTAVQHAYFPSVYRVKGGIVVIGMTLSAQVMANGAGSRIMIRGHGGDKKEFSDSMVECL